MITDQGRIGLHQNTPDRRRRLWTSRPVYRRGADQAGRRARQPACDQGRRAGPAAHPLRTGSVQHRPGPQVDRRSQRSCVPCSNTTRRASSAACTSATTSTHKDLLASYDAVVYATGAMRDRRMGVPGKDLPGSVAATDFVDSYSGHPDIDPDKCGLDASRGGHQRRRRGRDVARILAQDPEELRATDISQPMLDTLMRRKVREVHMVGRRDPAKAKFTTRNCASWATARRRPRGLRRRD